MSDEENDNYEYTYWSEDEYDEADEEAPTNKRSKSSFTVDADTTREKYLDADSQDFRIWATGCTIKMSITSAVRQLVEHPSGKLSVLCSKDELYADTPIKKMMVFVDVAPSMTVVYELKFDSSKELKSSPPRLKCLTYCGAGTFLFPNLLLPNCLGQFVDFGKVFYRLSEELVKYRDAFEPFVSITESDVFYLIQELAYCTQFSTKSVISLEDNGIITGMERQSALSESKGVGYSSGMDIISIKRDMSYTTHLCTLIRGISSQFSPKAIVGPLVELVECMVRELSVEEITRNAAYAEELFNLISLIQRTSSNEEKQSGGCGLSDDTLRKLNRFKTTLNGEYGLDAICIPEFVIAEEAAASAALKGSAGGEPVVFIEQFARHTYIQDSRCISAGGSLSGRLMRRINIELSTLSSSLPHYIRLMVLESNPCVCKFLIRGPEDTPYEGGFFLFDMKLPDDYPSNPPSVTFLTTGGGSVRFNPNLYNEGKVCLSLLGTWPGEKWDSSLSNINQVLQSICFLILVPEPYFNEPGYQASQGTRLGEEESERYNREIRVHTIRSAVLDHLTSPDAEFGDVIYSMLRESWPKTKAIFTRWGDEDPNSKNTIRGLIRQIDNHVNA